MAKIAATGLTLPLDEAQKSLIDTKGNLIEFEEQKDGTFKSKKATEGDGYNYTYELVAHPALVTVYVTKTKKGEEKKVSTSKEEQKAIEDAKTVAENAPDAKTKKEAERVASIGGKSYK